MLDLLSEYYLWLKALHIISFISWMAGLLYLPRLFVHHATTKPGSEVSNYFITMEQKLLRIIMLPAMILTFVFGIALLLVPGLIDWTAGWLHIKLTLVLILAGSHGAMIRFFKDFRNDRRIWSSRFFRLANEVPTLIMIGIVIMVVVKPF